MDELTITLSFENFCSKPLERVPFTSKGLGDGGVGRRRMMRQRRITTT